MSRLSRAVACLLILAVAAPLSGQDKEVPYWASIRSKVVNLRVGPGTTYRIDWVYKRPLLPVKVLRRKEGWRLVEDPDGTQGWMTGGLLSRKRTIIVTGEGLADMRKEAAASSPLLWRLEPGVVAGLGECTAGWCEVEIRGHKGFVRGDRLWGTGEP